MAEKISLLIGVFRHQADTVGRKGIQQLRFPSMQELMVSVVPPRPTDRFA